MKRFVNLLIFAILLSVPAIAQAPEYDHRGKEVDFQAVKVKNWSGSMLRSHVPGGWIVMTFIGKQMNTCFYPDPNHEWQPATVNSAHWD